MNSLIMTGRSVGLFRFPTICFGLAVVLTGMLKSASAAPAEFLALPEQRAVINVEGREVTIVYTPSIKLPQQTGVESLLLQIFIDGNLGELQSVLPGVLAKEHKADECGDRIRVHSVSLTAVGDIARLIGTVKYERWECVKTRVPEFRGLKVTFNDRIVAKTRLLEQSATLCVELRPIIEDQGRSVRLGSAVTCVQPSDRSLIGKINSLVNLEGLFRSLASGVLDKVGDKLKMSIPNEIRPFDPRLTQAAFKDRGGGQLGLMAEGHVTVTLAQIGDLLGKLRKR